MRPLNSTEPECIGWKQWFELLPTALPRVCKNGVGMVRYAMGTRGDPLLEPISVEPRRTAWTDEADRVATTVMKRSTVVDHSRRAWYFAQALSSRDGATFDEDGEEELYVAAMLHDTGLFIDDRLNGFAAAGAELARATAERAGVRDTRARAVEKAIREHVSVKPTTALGHYLQDGTLLDVAGVRLVEIDPNALTNAWDKWARNGFRDEVLALWSEECRRHRYGRAAYARFPCFMTFAARHARLPT